MRKRARLGLSFGENLIADEQKPRKNTDSMEVFSEEEKQNLRPSWITAIFTIGILILFGRSFWLAAVKGNYYRTIADENRIRQEVIRAPRGLILDRNEEKLAVNIPLFRMELRDTAGKVSGYEAIDRESALRRESEGLPTVIDPGRYYPESSISAHLVGYVSEATKNELGDSELKGYCGSSDNKKLVLGDLRGRNGIEQQYDCILRGINGRKIYETDTSGKIVRIMGERQPVVGNNLKTTLDNRLQRTAFGALGEKDGAVVALDVKTGALLVMVSSPSFDPNAFTVVQKGQETYINTILTSQSFPMLNRAIGGAYPAGSTFKLAVATAALSEGKISALYTINDPGIISAGGLTFANWYFSEYGGREGVVNVVRAITRSTDTFFYEVGAATGPEIIADWAGRLGLGKLTGIDLPGETAGLIPTPEWKLKTKDEQWYLGNTYNMAIGQGDVLVTPLQIALMTQALAESGRICTPYLSWGSGPNCKQVEIKDAILKLIKSGMVGACSPGGTAFPLFDFKPQVACKTGTAQYGIEGKMTHAWLTAYAPADDPEIVVTALVEGGGEGSAIAAPVAKAVLTEYFKDK